MRFGCSGEGAVHALSCAGKEVNMKRTAHVIVGWLALTIGLFGPSTIGAGQSRSAPRRQAPIFKADPAWPKIPNGWILGDASSIAVDAQDHLWLLHRPGTVRPAQKAMAAPPVIELDANGNFVQRSEERRVGKECRSR